MRGRELFHSWVFAVVAVWSVGLAVGAVVGCNKDDVAPQMKPPSNDLWDAPPQEKPEAPPVGGGRPGGVPSGGGDEGPQPGAEGGEPSSARATATGNLPPPPEGDDIPLGAPPLPPDVKGVRIKGTVVYSGYRGGLIQIDVTDKGVINGRKGAQPKIIQLYRMEEPGPFEMEVPENQGEIWFSAYNDEDKNGRPSREEPRGSAKGNPYKVVTSDIEQIEIELIREKIPPPP